MAPRYISSKLLIIIIITLSTADTFTVYCKQVFINSAVTKEEEEEKKNLY